MLVCRASFIYDTIWHQKLKATGNTSSVFPDFVMCSDLVSVSDVRFYLASFDSFRGELFTQNKFGQSANPWNEVALSFKMLQK